MTAEPVHQSSVDMTITAALEEAIAVTEEAVADPARDSRWPWVRRKAEGRWLASEWRAKAIADQYFDELVVEAAARVTGRSQLLRPWHQPDVGAVVDDLRPRFGQIMSVTADNVAAIVYGEHTLALCPAELALAKKHAGELPDDVFRVVQRRDFLSKPGARGPEDNDHDLIAALTSEQARLPKHITLWRGEHPNTDYPQFARAVHESRPGDVLVDRRRPVSATLDPSIAAAGEFTFGQLLEAERTLEDGWLLEVTTNRALYAGDRVKRTGITDGNAPEEEVLVYVPRLVVTGHREALVRCSKGLKRVHVVACVPDEDCAPPQSA